MTRSLPHLNALVTGASGFIGRNLIPQLLSTGYNVVGLDRRTVNTQTISLQRDIVACNFDEILKNIDVVFHLAGLLGTSELFEKTIEAENVNVLGTLNLLESMRKNDVSKIVFTSKPNIWKYNVYTVTKENCERYLEMYRSIYGFDVVITRPFNVYGPFQYPLDYRKAIPHFIVASLRNEPLEVFGDGRQTMDPIHVSDVAMALQSCAEKLPIEIVDIGSSEPIKVNDLANKILELTGSKSKVIHKPMRKGEPLEGIPLCANGNMERLLGFKPKTGLENGLRTTITWYRQHLNEF
jgi:UDP-glucose 4-epimerase